MTDPIWTALWLIVLGAGLAAAMIVRWLGVPSTYVRDLLHVGAGVWVLGWPYWDTPALPLAIVVTVAIALPLVPVVAPRLRLAARLERSVTGGDESWRGLVLYGYAYALLTAVGLAFDPFPAAAGLLALSLGDGVGGAIGRRFGAHRFRPPFGKPKSVEGSVAVALAAAAGVLIAARVLDASPSPAAVVALAVIAAVTEAIAPRASDNLLVPVAVWAAAEVLV